MSSAVEAVYIFNQHKYNLLTLEVMYAKLTSEPVTASLNMSIVRVRPLHAPSYLFTKDIQNLDLR